MKGCDKVSYHGAGSVDQSLSRLLRRSSHVVVVLAGDMAEGRRHQDSRLQFVFLGPFSILLVAELRFGFPSLHGLHGAHDPGWGVDHFVYLPKVTLTCGRPAW